MFLEEKKEIKPVLKFGVAVISLGGILYATLRSKRIKPSISSPSQASSGDQAHIKGDKDELRSDNHVLQKKAKISDPISVGPEIYESSLPKSSPDGLTSVLSPSVRLNREKDSYLLPEFNELAKDFGFSPKKASFSPRKGLLPLDSDGEYPGECKFIQSGGSEQEIRSLRNMVKILKERERNLEIQLLEYYGLKEQETVSMELQNRLKINSMEAKLFRLKIESLQADKKRLEEQLANYAKVAAELDAAKAKIRLLKRKLRTESEHNKEQILALRERVMNLQEQEKKAVAADPDIQQNLQKLKDLEEQAKELRNANNSLRHENSELAQKLEYVQLLATSVLDDEETAELKEESQRLTEENQELTKNIERLQADHCTDIEELVHLRWVNACLRHELKNYRPGPGRTIGRYLSKTLSPMSEEKAKQLTAEYANKEGQGEKGINPTDSDSDRWSSSQASVLTDEDSSIDMSSANKTHSSSKRKLFGKVMRLLRGKDSRHNHHQHQNLSAETTTGAEDMEGRYSSDSPGCNSGVSTVD